MLGWDARTLVGDRHQTFIRNAIDSHRDRGTIRTVLDGVVEHVRDRLPQHQSIGSDCHLDRRVNDDLLVALFGKNAQRCRDISGELIEIDGLAKSYRIFLKQEGLLASVSGLFMRTYREVPAVRGIDSTGLPPEQAQKLADAALAESRAARP